MMDLISFPDSSKIWIYASDREIKGDLILYTQTKISEFTKTWSSHNQALRATGGLLHGYFLVFVVDDGFNNPGGCSIDHSVRFVKDLGNELNVDFFNRNLFYYLEKEKVKLILKEDLQSSFEQGIFTSNTLFFDTMVANKINFQKEWLKPLSKSWHSKFLKIPV